MSFSVGIIGLPNSGKSTLFKALTKKQVDIADYPFTTIDPNIGTVAVPDQRLEKIAEIVKPEKVTPTVIKFVDIAGLVKDAHKGEGMGNQFLSHIRPCDAVIEVVRCFDEKNNPEESIEIIDNELKMKDQEIGDNVLSSKPKIYLFNIKEKKDLAKLENSLTIDLKLEEEASELSPQEIKELDIQTKLDQLILTCYNGLNLITFFTITGGKETRAWTLEKGSDAITGAAKVHTDFSENFIKAEVISSEELIKIGSWSKAKELGKINLKGKEYIIQDGDVLEFKK
jgi:small GTP-binding protein